MTKIRYCIVYIYFLSFVLVSCAQERVFPLFPCTETLQQPYGINTHITRDWDPRWDFNLRTKEIEMCNILNVDYVRTDFDYFTEDVVFDSVISGASLGNINMYGVLNMRTPMFFWEDQQSYVSYIDRIIDRYGCNVTIWEVGNEFDLFKKQVESPEHYVNLLKMVCNKVKNRDRSSKIVLSSLTSTTSKFIKNISSNGASMYFDVVGLHHYNMPEKMPISYINLRELMDIDGWQKSVWLTECGMSTAVRENALNNERYINENLQAQLVPRYHLIAFAYGVDKVFWYNLKSYEKTYDKEDHYGLCHKDLSPKPAYKAYFTMTKLLTDESSRPQLEIDNGIYKASWVRNDKKHILALWCEDGIKTYNPQCEFRYAIDYLGKRIQLKNKVMKVSPGIIYLVDCK